eukprot:6332161-Amphidinium_carterae.1
MSEHFNQSLHACSSSRNIKLYRHAECDPMSESDADNPCLTPPWTPHAATRMCATTLADLWR